MENSGVPRVCARPSQSGPVSETLEHFPLSTSKLPSKEDFTSSSPFRITLNNSYFLNYQEQQSKERIAS